MFDPHSLDQCRRFWAATQYCSVHIHDGLDLLVDFSLVSFPVNNWGDFVVGVLEDVLVNDGVEDVPDSWWQKKGTPKGQSR